MPSIRKNIPYKILAIGNCSAEIFRCSLKVLILQEIMTSSEMIFRFQEIIGVLIQRSILNFLVNLNSKGSYFPGKLDSRVLISRVLFYHDTGTLPIHLLVAESGRPISVLFNFLSIRTFLMNPQSNLLAIHPKIRIRSGTFEQVIW